MPEKFKEHERESQSHAWLERKGACGMQLSCRGATPIKQLSQVCDQAMPSRTKPAWLRARASWKRVQVRGAYGQRSLVRGIPQPREMFCPWNTSISTNKLWSVVRFRVDRPKDDDVIFRGHRRRNCLWLYEVKLCPSFSDEIAKGALRKVCIAENS